MGGRYRVTGKTYPRMRRPRKRGRIVALTALPVALLGVLGWGTLQLIDVFTGGDEASAAGSSAECATRPSPSPTPAKAYPRPDGITVNVLNATTRGGLAKKTADELKKRGFRIGEVGNAPAEYDKKVKGAGLLMGAPDTADTVLPVLGTQLAGAEVRPDAARRPDGKAKTPVVDLIIGDAFKDLATPVDADKALTALTAPAPDPKATRKGC
ncbi:LytR C-terminal domain-containing protein [Streptomyces abyssomicinicus]|uniref:LytR C-terminal domain-containing protein n=1 Tax=Streptomyces abyssomicinicus TaxID=574929 RepID=UPI00124FE355|nr:LytR C-terminal domain-containing protein [Streptomyces abyssomicinicus]